MESAQHGFQNISEGIIDKLGLVGGITKRYIRSEAMSWSLHIKTNNGWQYRFRDETGDWYKLRVVVTSWGHVVSYNSDKPNINRVEWYKPFI